MDFTHWGTFLCKCVLNALGVGLFIAPCAAPPFEGASILPKGLYERVMLRRALLPNQKATIKWLFVFSVGVL